VGFQRAHSSSELSVTHTNSLHLRCGTSLFRIDDTLEFDPVFNPAEQRRIKAWEKTNGRRLR